MCPHAQKVLPTTSFHLSSPSRCNWWIRTVPFYNHWYIEDLRTFFAAIRLPLFHILSKLALSKATQYDSKYRWIALELVPTIFLFLYLFWIFVVPLKEDWQGQIVQVIRDSGWPKCRQLLGLDPKGILRRLFRKILRATIRTRIKVVVK